MSIEVVTRQDPRFASLNQGHNARFPPSLSDAADRIEVCDTPEDVAQALQRVVSSGQRPTVRSGGHCYEDFVYTNPHGTILDLSLLTHTTPIAGAPRYRIEAGTQLATAYLDLYKRYGVTLPGRIMRHCRRRRAYLRRRLRGVVASARTHMRLGFRR